MFSVGYESTSFRFDHIQVEPNTNDPIARSTKLVDSLDLLAELLEATQDLDVYQRIINEASLHQYHCIFKYFASNAVIFPD